MSGRGDIRMYVEHLFEGRTLDAETIELKEEIYGNLTARFDDYVAQGMSEDEAYKRTCEAVTSVNDVMGEKDEPVDATTVIPAATAAPEPTTVLEAPPASEPAPAEPPARWSTAKIVAAVAVVLVIAGIAGCTVFNMVDTRRAVDDYQGQTSQNVEQVDQGDDTTYTEEKQPEDTTSTEQTPDATTTTTTTDQTTDTTTTQTSEPGSAPQDGTGNRHGAPAQSGTGLVGEVQSHAVDDLAAYAGTGSSDTSRVKSLFGSLPVSEYLTGVESTAAGSVTVTYEYQDRDLVARDDDHVDLALVYDAVSAMCAIDDLQTLTLVEVEPDDGRMERDTQVFERSMLEGLLGTSLDGSKLSAGAWDDLRSQVMTERIYDTAWELAERD